MFKQERILHIVAAVLLLTAVQVIAFVEYFGVQKQGSFQDRQVFCTKEAKLCPDGSAVGRTGPNCEFAECPVLGVGDINISTWQTYRNEEYGFEFRYPDDWVLRDGTGIVHLVIQSPHPPDSMSVNIIKTTEGEFIGLLGENVVKEGNIFIDNVVANKYLFQDTRGLRTINVFFTKTDLDGLTFYLASSTENPIFNLFLSTFKFIE